jgi:hypothetical protein
MKPSAATTEGKIALYDQMITVEEICKILTKDLSEVAREKFYKLKDLRPAAWWNETYLEDLRVCAQAYALIVDYQNKETKLAAKGDLVQAKIANQLVVSNVKIVDQYCLRLQLTPIAALKTKVGDRSMMPTVNAEEELKKIMPKIDKINLYAH